MARGGGPGSLLVAVAAHGQRRPVLLRLRGLAANPSSCCSPLLLGGRRKRPAPGAAPLTPWECGRSGSASASFMTSSSSSGAGDQQQHLREHRVQRVVPFTCEQLFDVVADVGRYKLFLPYCKDSVVLRQTPPNFMLAQLYVGFNPALGERYTSRVRLDRPWAITTAALDSQIFSRLESVWRFQPGPEDPERTAAVDFTVRFQVGNPVARAAVDLVFRDVAAEQMRAFERRCQLVYHGHGHGGGGGGGGEGQQR